MKTRLHFVSTLTFAAITCFSLPSVAQKQKWTGGKIDSEVTTWVNRPSDALPAGVTHHTYRSQSMGHDLGYCIYLPPNYANDSTRRYPVIYNLHGAGGDETRGLLAAEVLHEGIQAGRWPEMILVFPNGGKRTHYKDSYDGKSMAETTVIKELIPHVDATYRTIAARHRRCIGGLFHGWTRVNKACTQVPGDVLLAVQSGWQRVSRG